MPCSRTQHGLTRVGEPRSDLHPYESISSLTAFSCYLKNWHIPLKIRTHVKLLQPLSIFHIDIHLCRTYAGKENCFRLIFNQSVIIFDWIMLFDLVSILFNNRFE